MALALSSCGGPGERTAGPTGESASAAQLRRVVRVAPPTGQGGTDDVSIRAALAAAREGDVIEFGAGVYRVSNGITYEVATPGVEMRGSTGPGDLTTFRGGSIGHEAFSSPTFRLTGADQTVRNIGFLQVPVGLELRESGGPYLVEGSRFRNARTGVAVSGPIPGVTIRRNRFVNVGSPIRLVSITGARVSSNAMLVPDPDAIPISPRAQAAVELGCTIEVCAGNIIEDNVVSGYSEGVLLAPRFGSILEDNVIRRNRFTDLHALSEFETGSMVAQELTGGFVRDNRIANNTLQGTTGPGILLTDAVRTTIVGNSFSDVTGGPGVLVEAASGQNRILENTFKGGIGPDILLQGDRNRVVTKGATTVVDEGDRNRVD